MSKGANQPRQRELANIEDAEIDSNQQAVPLPYVAGEAKLKAIWVTPDFKIFSKKVSPSRGGKK